MNNIVPPIRRGHPIPCYYAGKRYPTKKEAMAAVRRDMKNIYDSGVPSSAGKVSVPPENFPHFLDLLKSHANNDSDAKRRAKQDGEVVDLMVGEAVPSGHNLWFRLRDGTEEDFSIKHCFGSQEGSHDAGRRSMGTTTEEKKIRDAAWEKEKEKITETGGYAKDHSEKNETGETTIPPSTRKRTGARFMFIDVIDAARDRINTTGILGVKHISGAAAVVKRQKKAEHTAGIGKNAKMKKKERVQSPGEKRIGDEEETPAASTDKRKDMDPVEKTPSIGDDNIPPATREAIFKTHRIIAQSLSDWRRKFPCIVRVLPCRWQDSPVEVCINVYHRIGDLSAFPRNVVIDEVLTVPVRFFSASVPTSRLADARNAPVPSATKKFSRTSNELRAVIERHTPGLFGRFNVTMVSASANGDSDCIVVSVTHKDCLPYLDAPIPTSLDGFPVVVLEREFRFHAAEDEIDSRQRPLTSGSRISVPGLTSDAFGTLGAIVRTDRENYILTCRHVFPLLLNFPSYTCLCQPTGDNSVVGQGVVDISHTGSVRETTVDAALVKTNEEVCRSFATSTASWQRAVRKANEAGASLAITGDQPVVGVDIFDVGGVSDTSGYVMMKIGYTTHITFGMMKLCTVVASPTPIIPESVEIDVIFGFYTRRTIAYNHFIVVPVSGAIFSDQGDSGSLVCVVDKDVARPAGLLVGACGAETLVTPLRAVLDRAEAVLKKTVRL